MKKLIILMAVNLCLITNVKSQDTIFVKEGGKVDFQINTVICKITKVASMNIFYTENKIGKTILLSDVYSYKTISTQSSDIKKD